MRSASLARIVLHQHGSGWAWVETGAFFGRNRVTAAGPDCTRLPESSSRIDVVIHSPEVRLTRIDLSGASVREARRVAERRAYELSDQESESMQVSTLVERADWGAVIWLVSGPAAALDEIDRDLEARGVAAHRLLHQGLAFGAFARLLAKPLDGGLTALLWIEGDAGYCVVVDAFGWKFERQISLKVGIGRDGDGAYADAIEWAETDHVLVEHLSVELERTFAYVERQLDLGRVERVLLCGPLPRLDDLQRALAANFAVPIGRLGEEPLPRLGWSPHPACALALGAAVLGGGPNEASLLSHTRGAPRLRARLRRGLSSSALAAALISALALAAGGLQLTRSSAALARSRAELERWEEERPILGRLASQRERIIRIVEARDALERPEPDWAALLVALGAALPDELIVQRLFASRESSGSWQLEIWVEGEGVDPFVVGECANELGTRLSALPLFRLQAPRRELEAVQDARGAHHLALWIAPVDPRSDDGPY